MPSLVIRDGVHAPHGDIFLKRTLASITSGCIGVTPSSNSSASMHMVFLVQPNGRTLMHSVCVDLPVCAGGHAHQLSTTCSSPVKLSSFLHLGECVEWVGSHVCAQ